MEIKKTDLQLKIINTIKQLRQNDQESQAFICEILELRSDGLIGNIESPKYKHKYTLKQLRTLCRHFNLRLEQLFLCEDELKLGVDERIDCLIEKIIEYDG